jgi:hypothetical protein
VAAMYRSSTLGDQPRLASKQFCPDVTIPEQTVKVQQLTSEMRRAGLAKEFIDQVAPLDILVNADVFF